MTEKFVDVLAIIFCIIIISACIVGVISGTCDIIQDLTKPENEGYYYIDIEKDTLDPKGVLLSWEDVSSGSKYSSYSECLENYNVLIAARKDAGYDVFYTRYEEYNDKVCPVTCFVGNYTDEGSTVYSYAIKFKGGII